jgi:murein DD-endopeptidase
MADGRNRLLYELHLANYAPLPIQLTAIDVLGDGTTALASYRGQALDKVVILIEKLSLPKEPRSSSANAQAVGEGHSVVIFLDLTLDGSARPPAELLHRFSFSVARKNKAPYEATLDGPVVAVVQEPAPVSRAPLLGSVWVAFNALGSADHRRSLNALDGKERIPQRFAVDWMRLGPDGRLFRGDAKSNANFYDYGAEVLAVADSRVSDLKDGLPDNVGSNERSSRNITLDNTFGNYVTLDLGSMPFRRCKACVVGRAVAPIGDRACDAEKIRVLCVHVTSLRYSQCAVLFTGLNKL